MEVFISWSGRRSEAAAKAVKDWLPYLINDVEPWLSSSDIDKGSRWSSEIAAHLDSAKVGIICVTPANLHEDWLLFEAGALAKKVAKPYVCPLLVGLKPADLKEPLAQFQATTIERDDFFRLVVTLNQALEAEALPAAHLETAFKHWWPELEAKFRSLPNDHETEPVPRGERDMIEEILGLLRNLSRAADTASATIAMPKRLSPVAAAERQKRYDAFSKAVRLIEPDIETVLAKEEADTEVFEVRTKHGRSFRFVVPWVVPAEQIHPWIISAVAASANRKDR